MSFLKSFCAVHKLVFFIIKLKMKLLVSLFCAASAAVEYECFLRCYRDYVRLSFKCDNDHQNGSIEHKENGFK